MQMDLTADLMKDVPRALSAKYTSDFAYPTVKDRMPVILTKVIDTVYRMRSDVLKDIGEKGLTDLKRIAGELSRLKNYMQTNKPLTDIVHDGTGDEELWNNYLQADRDVQQQGGCISAWFVSPWLLTECYFYRCIISAIRSSEYLKSLDPYGDQKREAFQQSQEAMMPLISRLSNVKNNLNEQGQSLTAFREFLSVSINRTGSLSPFGDAVKLLGLDCELTPVSLWGNKCDLSISAGSANHQLDIDPIGQAVRLQSNILHDDTEAIWRHLASSKQNGVIDIVLDNAGFELFTDLCLAELLTSVGMATTVRFHAKCIPWFVSDVVTDDWQWTINQLTSASGDQSIFQAFGETCKQRLADGTWQFKTHQFWTLPHDFAAMKETAPDLYSSFVGSDLVIFKGDLNYRKLVGDRLWPTTTPFSHALRGFGPAPLCTLRTLKCDLITGLEPGKAESMAMVAADWMLTGSYAVIQFYCPNRV